MNNELYNKSVLSRSKVHEMERRNLENKIAELEAELALKDRALDIIGREIAKQDHAYLMQVFEQATCPRQS